MAMNTDPLPVERQIFEAAKVFNTAPGVEQPTITLQSTFGKKAYQVVLGDKGIGLKIYEPNPLAGSKPSKITFLSHDCERSHKPGTVEWVIKMLVMREQGVNAEAAAFTLNHISQRGFMRLHDGDGGFTQARAKEVLPHLTKLHHNYILSQRSLSLEHLTDYINALLPLEPPPSREDENRQFVIRSRLKTLIAEDARGAVIVFNSLENIAFVAETVLGLEDAQQLELLAKLSPEIVAIVLEKIPAEFIVAKYRASISPCNLPEGIDFGAGSKSPSQNFVRRSSRQAKHTPSVEVQEIVPIGDDSNRIKEVVAACSPRVAARILNSFPQRQKELFGELFSKVGVFNELRLLMLPPNSIKPEIDILVIFNEIFSSEPETAKNILKQLDQETAVYLFRKLNRDDAKELLCECQSQTVAAVLVEVYPKDIELLFCTLGYDVRKERLQQPKAFERLKAIFNEIFPVAVKVKITTQLLQDDDLLELIETVHSVDLGSLLLPLGEEKAVMVINHEQFSAERLHWLLLSGFPADILNRTEITKLSAAFALIDNNFCVDKAVALLVNLDEQTAVNILNSECVCDTLIARLLLSALTITPKLSALLKKTESWKLSMGSNVVPCVACNADGIRFGEMLNGLADELVVKVINDEEFEVSSLACLLSAAENKLELIRVLKQIDISKLSSTLNELNTVQLVRLLMLLEQEVVVNVINHKQFSADKFAQLVTVERLRPELTDAFIGSVFKGKDYQKQAVLLIAMWREDLDVSIVETEISPELIRYLWQQVGKEIKAKDMALLLDGITKKKRRGF